MASPDLHRLDAPGRPSGVVVMLHGGQPDSHAPVGDDSLSWRRSRWMQGQVAPRLHAHGLSLWLLRYRHRGWNAGAPTGPSPVPDARWALAEVRRTHGDLPVVLLGHSMGVRTAVAVADDPMVVGVVGLAAWLPAGEPVHTLAGKHLAVAHGRADRVTSYRATETFVQRARQVAASVELEDMGMVGHYMLRRLRAWNRFATSRSLALVADRHAER